MKERPIIFSGEMVRAILNGRKTQTRRVITRVAGYKELIVAGEIADPQMALDKYPNYQCLFASMCPYGQPGDRLWVRESFYVQPELAPLSEPQPIHYRADTPPEQVEDYICKPSIHMPRWASRITLEITNVRIEEVQDIGETDAMAEGVIPGADEHYLTAFVRLWDSINAKRGYGWDVNPWVWVIEFRVAA